MSLWLISAAFAASLPGVPVPFDVDGSGSWVLPEGLPKALADAGVEPGWVLTEVDEQAFDPVATPRSVAAGPARPVRLTFLDPTPAAPAAEGGPPAPAEAIVMIRRADLVLAAETEVVAWPAGFVAPARAWAEDANGSPLIQDAKNAYWRFDPITAAITRADPSAQLPFGVPGVMWSLSDASWVIDRSGNLEVGDRSWARNELSGTARVRGFRGRPGDQLLVGTPRGLEVLQLSWPYGTPPLPTCSGAVPETCLASGRQILAELGKLPGARDEAHRQFELACSRGVYRGCFEVEALDEPTLALKVQQCLGGQLSACNTVAAERFALEPEAPTGVTLGMLEHACTLEGSGTLAERLRRLEDAGAGCMLLASGYDKLGQADQALLNLDQACVLGRAEACEQATERRAQAFAARTVRECEDTTVPNAASCVDLGKLLRTKPVAAATLDEFGAFLRGCELGAPEGCLNLGDYVDRWGIDHPRVREAEDKLLASCGSGEQRSCLGAGNLLVRHEPRTKAYGEALQLFDKACQAGLAAACEDGARQRRIGRAKRVKAPNQEDMWMSACDANSATGCAGLGDVLQRAKPGWASAFTAFTRACDLGEPTACTDLGQLVAKPHGKEWGGEQPPDDYLQRGCDNGDAEGCFLRAQSTMPRRGPPDDPTYVMLDRSCAGKYGEGCNQLAEVHISRKTSFDDEIAARHYDTACANGYYESCRELGLMYLSGQGVERDRSKANELLDKFKLNAKPKYLRVGVVGGLPTVAGFEGELIVPFPIGPAFGVAATYSRVPGVGGILVTVSGDEQPADAATYTTVGAMVRMYPNHQARGSYAAFGVERLGDTDPTTFYERVGFSFRLGMRNDTKFGYSGIEMGVGTYGSIDLNAFDPDTTGSFPLIVPTLALSIGLAPF